MKFSLNLPLILASIAAFATATPTTLPTGTATLIKAGTANERIPLPPTTNTTDTTIAKRIYFPRERWFRDINFGDEISENLPGGICWTYYEDWKNDKVSSAIIQPGTMCQIYYDWDCGGSYYLQLTAGYFADFRTFDFQDKMSSYACFLA